MLPASELFFKIPAHFSRNLCRVLPPFDGLYIRRANPRSFRPSQSHQRSTRVLATRFRVRLTFVPKVCSGQVALSLSNGVHK